VRITHAIRRMRRNLRSLTIACRATWQVQQRVTRGGLYVFRDCPTLICVMYARDHMGQPELTEAAEQEIAMRVERRRLRNGWASHSEVA